MESCVSFECRAAGGPSGSSTPSTPGERRSCSSAETRRATTGSTRSMLVADSLYDEHLEELRKEGLIE